MSGRRLWTCFLLTLVTVCFFIYFRSMFSNDLLLQISPAGNYDHPYRNILFVDNKTRFLDSSVRNFLYKTQEIAFPTRYNAVFLDTLLEFDRIWRQELGRSYMLYAGTLLGAYRHGSRTPWDDDLDLMVDIKYNASVERDLKGSRFFVTKGGPFRKVFFTHNGTTMNKYGHWPFIDLFFYKIQNNGKEMVVIPTATVYQTQDVFPSSEISYMGHTFPTPRCPKTFAFQMTYKYVLRDCCNYGYNHRLDKHGSPTCVRCSSLRGLFQFAEYRRINESYSQQLLSVPLDQTELVEKKEEKWKEGPILQMPDC